MIMLWKAPALLVLVVTWLTATPTSLADLAQREAMRRALTVPSAGTFTNDSLPYIPVMAVAETPPPGDPDDVVVTELTAALAETVVADQQAGPAAAGKQDEAWWRNRMATARDALERSRMLEDAMQARIGALQTDIVNRDDPASRAVLQEQLRRVLDERERLAKQIEADEKAIEDIRTDARKQRVSPAWVR